MNGNRKFWYNTIYLCWMHNAYQFIWTRKAETHPISRKTYRMIIIIFLIYWTEEKRKKSTKNDFESKDKIEKIKIQHLASSTLISILSICCQRTSVLTFNKINFTWKSIGPIPTKWLQLLTNQCLYLVQRFYVPHSLCSSCSLNEDKI